MTTADGVLRIFLFSFNLRPTFSETEHETASLLGLFTRTQRVSKQTHSQLHVVTSQMSVSCRSWTWYLIFFLKMMSDNFKQHFNIFWSDARRSLYYNHTPRCSVVWWLIIFHLLCTYFKPTSTMAKRATKFVVYNVESSHLTKQCSPKMGLKQNVYLTKLQIWESMLKDKEESKKASGPNVNCPQLSPSAENKQTDSCDANWLQTQTMYSWMMEAL